MASDNLFPKISIVTVCYNHARFVAETIESIVSQRYPNLEYIVIDDGSTDGSWDVIQTYRDRLSSCERMEGYRDTPVTALNHGFQKTSGEIMMFLNSDDILLPKSLFTIAKIFCEHPEVVWCTGMATTINQRSEIVNSNLWMKHQYDYLIGAWKIIQQESTFWRRSLWEKAGGKLEGEKKWAFDTELWTRFFAHAQHHHVTTPIGAFRSGAQSKSVSNRASFMEPSLLYLKRFQKRARMSVRLQSRLYQLMRILRPCLSLIPHSLYQKLPFFNTFGYRVLTYSFSRDRWETTIHNPF